MTYDELSFLILGITIGMNIGAIMMLVALRSVYNPWIKELDERVKFWYEQSRKK